MAIKNILASLGGKNSSRKRIKEEGVDFYREMGRRSAEKRKNNKSYYSDLGKRSVAARRARKQERERLERQKRSPLTKINDFITGK